MTRTGRHTAIRGGSAPYLVRLAPPRREKDAWHATVVFWTISPGPYHRDPLARRDIAAAAAQTVGCAGLPGDARGAGGQQGGVAGGRLARNGGGRGSAENLSGANSPGAGGQCAGATVHCDGAPAGV